MTIGAEVVDDVANAVAGFAAKGDLMAAFGPAHGVGELILLADEVVGVAGIQRVEVAGDGDVILRLVVVEHVDAEILEALGRVYRDGVAIGVVVAEEELIGERGADDVCVRDGDTGVVPAALGCGLEIIGGIQQARSAGDGAPETAAQAIAGGDLLVSADQELIVAEGVGRCDRNGIAGGGERDVVAQNGRAYRVKE